MIKKIMFPSIISDVFQNYYYRSSWWNIGRLFAGKEMEETEGNSQQSLEDWVESLTFNI